MKKLPLFLIFSSLYLLIGCQHQSDNSDELPAFINEGSDKAVSYFFSNEDQLEEEMSYYDALLDFNRNYPERLDSIKIITEQNDELIEYFNVHVYPTLLVIEEQKVTVRLEGFMNFQDIYSTLETTLIAALEDAS